MSEADLVLPRPGASYDPSQPPITAPSESSFTQTFGTLLPPAQYLTTHHGKAAYYEFLPTSSTSSPFNCVLFIHGVQTPALGLYPLARALHTTFPAKHFALVDLWGHGLTDTPIAPHASSLFHSLIDALLDHLSWPSVHLVGFSFGGALTVGYVSSRPSRVQSFTLIAPAGLMRRSDFDEAHFVSGGDEGAAQKYIINDVLEDGGLVVPEDWEERVAKGEVVAPALKDWQMRNHLGHAASVVGVFRDGGVLDNDGAFAEALESGLPNLVVLGEGDDVCTKEQLVELGFRDIRVIGDVGHEVVRAKVPEVAAFIAEFWKGLDGA